MEPLKKPYDVDVPGLSDTLRGVRPTKGRSELLRAIGDSSSRFSDVKVTAEIGDSSLLKHQVRTASGELVADDHRVWLATQVAMDGGDASSTFRRLREGAYLLTRCELLEICLVADVDHQRPDGFVQMRVWEESERLHRALFEQYPWRVPTDLDELVRDADHGDPLPIEAQSLVRPVSYQLRAIVDVARWLDEADALEEARRETVRRRRYTVRETRNGKVVSEHLATHDELNQGWDAFPGPHRRLFDDWARSSAGRAARLCDHWRLDLADYTAPDGTRSMSLVPQWTFTKKLAEVSATRGGDYELFGSLEKLDRRVGVPFGWFFFMLHGNRVTSDAGERVIRAAEAGLIVIPEHDYRVLKDWQDAPYGF